MNKTCNKDEFLVLDEKIRNLADNTLTNDEIKECEIIVREIIDKKTRIKGIDKLRAKIKGGPKRPLYYADHELSQLPRWTRDTVRYLGDYIDCLVKFIASNNENMNKKSLGINVKGLKDKIDLELYDKLKLYNDSIYVPAKHDFNTKGKKHRFTTIDVVYTVFITKKLEKLIVPLSKKAKDYSLNKVII